MYSLVHDSFIWPICCLLSAAGTEMDDHMAGQLASPDHYDRLTDWKFSDNYQQTDEASMTVSPIGCSL